MFLVLCEKTSVTTSILMITMSMGSRMALGQKAYQTAGGFHAIHIFFNAYSILDENNLA